jgi:hypothetical protein
VSYDVCRLNHFKVFLGFFDTINFFFLLKYPKINAIIPKTNRKNKPIQKKDGVMF